MVVRVVLPTLLMAISIGLVQAQSSLLLQNIEVLDPSVSVDLYMSRSAGDCDAPGLETWQVVPRAFGCSLQGIASDQAIAADGSIIRWLSDSLQSDPTCVTSPPSQRDAVRITITTPDRLTRELLRIDTLRFSACEPGYPTRILSGIARVVPDLTNGLLRIYLDRTYSDPTTGVDLAHDSGVITVNGLPKLFDTFLSFVPEGHAMNIVAPAHPDGFRSADSFQVWTGDIRSMPDWSEAQPLTCISAQNPTPGQVVTVPDTLPDPAVGQGRYYLVASQSGQDRRLGRQYVNGAFSARDTAGLPECH